MAASAPAASVPAIVDRAVVLDVDLGAGRLPECPDGLAARADQQADLFRIDLDVRAAAGRSWQISAARPRDGREHRACRISTAGLAGLVERGPDDLLVDAVDLEVELDAGDAVVRAGDLEVHVAEVVLVAHDVGQQDELVRLP